jgi:hypothetical protein
MKFLFILLSSFCVLSSYAQVQVYTTQAEYENGGGTMYTDYLKWSGSGDNVTITFSDNGDKVKIKCADMWGFTYKDELFRTAKVNKGAQLGMLMSKGKVYYYENGVAHLRILKHGGEQFEIYGADGYGIMYYFSASETSDLVVIRLPFDNKKMDLYEFISRPEYKELYDCGVTNGLLVIRDCVALFNGNFHGVEYSGK